MIAPAAARRPLNRRLLLALLLGLAGVMSLVLSGLGSEGIDAYHYWAGSRLAAGAGAGFYRPAATAELLRREPEPKSVPELVAREYWRRRHATEHEQDGLFISTPFYWSAMRLLLAGDYEPALRRLQLLSIFGLVGGLILIGRVGGASALAIGALVAVVGLAFLPAADDVATGNVGHLLLAVGALWLTLGRTEREGPALAGDFLLGLSIAFKPIWWVVPPLAGAAGWASGERGRTLRRAAAAALGAGTGLALGALYMGSSGVWPAWARQIARARYVEGNISPLALVGALDRGAWVAPLVLLAGMAWVAWSARRGRWRGERLEEPHLLALGGLLFLVSSTLARPQYLVAALPAVALGISGWRRGHWLEPTLWGVAALAISYAPQRLGLVDGDVAAGLAATGVAGLTGGVAYRLWRRGRERPAGPPRGAAE